MATTVPYEPYRDEDPTRFRWRLGLRPLTLDAWLQFDEHVDADLALKRDLLDRHHGTVFAALNATDAPDDRSIDVAERASIVERVDTASAEVYELVVDWLSQHAPGRLAASDDDPVRHRLEAAARLVQEDLVLMVPTEAGLILGAGCVCYPNKWDLRSKLGRTMAAIHQPVPRLNDELADPIDGFLDRLSVDRPFWRLGWTVVPSPDLYLAVDGTADPVPSADPSEFVLRVERETLRRLPVSDAVLFTIRTYRTPLGHLEPDSAAALSAALGSLPGDVHEYKALADIGARAATYLRG